ncbi:MAG: tetratricopeptide repeat protein [Polyangiales bacterium]
MIHRNARVRSILVSAILVGGALVAPREAGAQAANQASQEQLARSIFLRGDVAFQEGRYQAAIDLFREAYRISPRPLLMFNIANAEERLGNLRNAITALTEYLPNAGREEAVIAARITNLRERLATQERADRERADRERAERESAERARLERERAERERAERERSEQERRPADRGQPARPTQPTTPTHSGRSGLFAPGLAMTLTGAGVVIVGAVFDGLALAASNTARATCMTVNGATLCPLTSREAIEGAQRNALIGDISLGVGAAVATVGVVLLFVDWGRSGSAESAPAPRSVSFGAVPIQGGAMGSLGVRF